MGGKKLTQKHSKEETESQTLAKIDLKISLKDSEDKIFDSRYQLVPGSQWNSKEYLSLQTIDDLQSGYRSGELQEKNKIRKYEIGYKSGELQRKIIIRKHEYAETLR